MRSVAILVLLLAASSAVRAEDPQQATVCQIKGNAAAYDHKLVQVTGFASHGFENFTLFDPQCRAFPEIWLEYGGKRSTLAEGRGVSLTEDKPFHDFDRLVQRPPESVAHATLVGRFFPEKRYGHMACCSLLVIQQVLAVDAQDRSELDFGSEADQPPATKAGCGFKILAKTAGKDAIDAQKEADAGAGAWMFDDPVRVAAASLTGLLKLEAGSSLSMSQTKKSTGRLVFEWKPAGKKVSYTVVAHRPYWLSFYAANPRKVAWVVMAVYESSCD